MERQQRRMTQGGLNYHIFNSFFATKLNGKYDYTIVQKWSEGAKIKVIDLDKLLFPVHSPGHWCLGVINFLDKRFEYYDSLGGTNNHLSACASMSKMRQRITARCLHTPWMVGRITSHVIYHVKRTVVIAVSSRASMLTTSPTAVSSSSPTTTYRTSGSSWRWNSPTNAAHRQGGPFAIVKFLNYA